MIFTVFLSLSHSFNTYILGTVPGAGQTALKETDLSGAIVCIESYMVPATWETEQEDCLSP